MAHESAFDDVGVPVELPGVRSIELADLKDALAKGVDDFMAKPSHLVFLGLLYPIVCLLGSRVVVGYDVLPLLFPILAGMALLGPLAAVGLYEMSRRREQGADMSWKQAFEVFRSPAIGPIVALGLVLAAIFLAWIGAAMGIYALIFGGMTVVSAGEFVRQIFTTPSGWTLMIVGNGVGLLFALLVLAIGTFSFPMLVDRQADPVTAVRTSVRAVLANLGTMLVWGLIVAGALVLGSLPLFIGLAVVVPVLGHSTWHLYRNVVEP